MSLLVSLTQRPFRLLWIGQTISRLGDQVYEIAQAWWVLQLTHSATTMGLVLIAGFLPTLVFVLIGGVIADRLPRLPIMLVSDVARGCLVAGMAALAFIGTLPLWPIIGISFCFGIMDAFFLPAYSAVIPQILTKEHLASANSLRILSARVMAIGGPALGAGLIVIGGTPIAFAINSASFFASALCLLRAIPALKGQTRPVRMPDVAPVERSVLAQFSLDFREGFATVRSLTWVWLTIAIAGVANLIAQGATNVALPFYVQQTLHNPLLYGGLTAATAGGDILGALWYGLRSYRHRGWVIFGFFILAMLMLTIMGLAPLPAVILGAMLMYGLSTTTLGLAWTTALQEYIPNEQMGRVVSVDELGSYIGIPLSFALGGIATDRLGATPVLVWGGILAAVVVASGLFSRSVRRLN